MSECISDEKGVGCEHRFSYPPNKTSLFQDLSSEKSAEARFSMSWLRASLIPSRTRSSVSGDPIGERSTMGVGPA